MKAFYTPTRRVTAAFVAVLLWSWTAAAQYPEPSCDPATWAPSASPAGLETWCDTKPADKSCDLKITSTDIRLGDSASTPIEKPRFFVDHANNRFYTRLYVRLRNDGDGPAPADHATVAPADQVRVNFFYKEGPTPALPNDPGWTPAGTLVGTLQSSYAMRIPPPATATVGALGAGETHIQEIPVCWSWTPGTLSFPQQFTIKAELSWGDDEDPSDDVAVRFYDLTTTVGRRAQIGLAIDLSGSMAGTKLTQALNRASLFAYLVENDDQLGVYGFATGLPAADKDSFTATYKTLGGATTTVTRDDVKEIFPMQTITGAPAQLADLAAILGQSAYGCTPVGQGLLRARQAILDSPPPSGGSGPAAKAIVIFSDGLQNVRPYVNTDPGYSCGPSSGLTIDANLTFNTGGSDDMTIYSVFFGPSSLYGYNTMWDVQNQTGGDFFLSTVTDLELAAAYYSIRALVDDMVYFEEKGTTSPTGPAHFEVEFDSAASQATVAVAWPVTDGKTRLKVFCRPKGTSDFADCAPQPTGEVNAVPDPGSFQVFRFNPGPDTTWEFQVRQITPRAGQTEYTAAVFTPVNQAQIFPSLETAGFEAGKPLPIHAELLSAGAGLTGADVQASVRVPARAVANSLRRYSGRFQRPPDDDAKANAILSQLQAFLLQDEGSDEIYVYRDVPVTLRDDGQGRDQTAGDGIYSGELPASETEVAGDYEVTITARATLASGRTVERVARLSAICNVAAPDPGRTQIRTVVSPDPVQGLRQATVTVQWADRFGNAAFPGSASQIAVTPVNATLQGSLVDNLDSTFSQAVTFAPGTRPELKIAVRGEAQGAFPLTDHPLRYRREISLHLGLAIPHGTLGSVFSNGPSLGVDFAYRVDRHFAVRAELVRDELDRSGGSEEILSFSAYLQYRRTSGPWSPYFETGLGVYDFESGGSALGFAAGIGAQRSVTPRWSFDFNLQEHRVGGTFDVGFGRVRAGAIYKF